VNERPATAKFGSVKLVDEAHEDFDLVVPVSSETFRVDVFHRDREVVTQHSVRLRTLAFGGLADRVDIGVLAVPGCKPVLVAKPGYHQDSEFERDRRAARHASQLGARERAIRLIGSPKAKDRNKGRRMARQAGWL
jgi:hypothetical protein